MRCLLLLIILFMGAVSTYAQQDDEEPIDELKPVDKTKKKDLPLSFYEETENAMKAKMVGVARNFVSVGIGVALPESSFGSSYDDLLSGYAKNGFQLSFDGAYVVERNVGFSGTFTLYTNGIKKIDYERNLMNRLPSDVTDGVLKTGRWMNVLLAAGPYIALPEDKVTLDLRLLVGLAVTRMPQITMNGLYGEESILYIREKALGASPALIIGVGVSYPLEMWSYDFRVFGKGEYIGAKPSFKFTEFTDSSSYKINNQIKYNQTTGNFNLTFGIKYEFGYVEDMFIGE